MPGPFQILQALFGNRIRMLENLGARIPRIGRADFGRISVVLVNAPDLVPEVLIDRADDYQKGPVLRIVSRPVLGDGLLTSEGRQHRERRKLIAPAFAHERVSKYAAVMTERADAAEARWRDGQGIDIAQEMMRLTLDIVGRTLFDVELLGKADSLGRDITLVQQAAILQTRMAFWLPFRSKYESALARLNETIYGMIHDRRAAGVDKGDLLSMLLLTTSEDTGRDLNDKEVRDEAITLFLAGHETTAQAMAWSVLFAGAEPTIFRTIAV